MKKSNVYNRLSEARQNKKVLNELISEYMPFIRSCVKKQVFNSQTVDDMMTVAMLTFTRCINHYDEDKGDFFTLAEKSIRRSIIDEHRLNSKHDHDISFDEMSNDDSNENFFEKEVSVIQFEMMKQQKDLELEIREFEEKLSERGLSFKILVRTCPKQKRSRELCQRAARLIINDKELIRAYAKSNRIPQNEIAERLDISPKTIEKHRRYITVLLLVLSGDYPLIRAFLPNMTEGGWE